ncbi:gluconate 2-dehydrogenase subunit 3 family protein [Marinimicrobium sp. ABcell2]|uniref:gluconate 2-dehydrogenase subunit 3 family protein n=1 Tax=Marinimicrobium sp. ABcell2 TaxID=3069751 RepID=UPI0027B3EA24|nr:gluconate 2-dehydrogenase subunit 3 family protein [Marinimicrobium sp. ABcell2]MDQ2077970.1 gluconate 2-dehydrogenase subunit 3 family protein [Marinimicrobium sp. ABcell2]
MQCKSVSRRGFLKSSAALSGVMVSGSAVMSGCSNGLISPYQTLTRREGQLVEILADRIIPPDSRNPGGKDARVPHFIDQQLGKHLSDSLEMYQACLPALNEACKSRHEVIFTELGEQEQILYLTDIEAGVYDSGPERRLWGHFAPSLFFSVLVDHCMMGYYGSPKHGGNKNYASYKMLGLFVEQVPMRPRSS